MKKAIVFIIIIILGSSAFSSYLNLGLAQSAGIITINADGSVSGTSSIAPLGNNIYKFSNSITGIIQIQASNIILDGDGYTLNGRVAWQMPREMT